MAKFKRPDGRAADALRPVTIEVGVSKFAEGSARIAFGDTIVLCLATLTDSVPRFLEGSGRGWITAEYAMLPRSTPERSQRESIAGRPGGRTFEIQRLIGRALRTTIDLKALGPRSVTVDCEVIQADGGTPAREHRRRRRQHRRDGHGQARRGPGHRGEGAVLA